MSRAPLRLVRTSGSPQDPERKATSIAPGPRAKDDAQLLVAMQGGNEQAASELHDRLRPRVDTVIRALVGRGHADHDDLAQQSFIEIVVSLDRYRGECSLETWAATITARTVFKFLRRRGVERRVFRDVGEHVDEPQSRSSLKRQIIARGLADRIREHLDAIEPAKAEAFLLHDVCGFDAREVAGLAGISESAAHARIARGRRELHERLAQDPELRDALVDMEVES